jgi:glutamate/tyrosine decarboxylase-like PLP-dependent enzyme
VIAQMLTLWAGVGVAVAGGALAVMRAVVAYRRQWPIRKTLWSLTGAAGLLIVAQSLTTVLIARIG